MQYKTHIIHATNNKLIEINDDLIRVNIICKEKREKNRIRMDIKKPFLFIVLKFDFLNFITKCYVVDVLYFIHVNS